MKHILYDFACLMSRISLFFVCGCFLTLGNNIPTRNICILVGVYVLTAFAFWIMRKKLRNSALFLGLHLVWIVGLWFLVPNSMKLPAIGVLGLVADSVYCRLRKNGNGEYGMHWAPAALLCLLYALGAAYGMKQFLGICFYGTVLFITGWFWQTGLKRTAQLITDSEGMADVPADKIYTQSGGILAVFSGSVLALMILAPMTFLIRLLQWGRQGIFFVISKLLGMIEIKEPDGKAAESIPDMGSVFQGGLFEPNEPLSPVWDVLDNIVFILMYIAIFCGICVLTWFVVKKVRELFRMQLQTEETDVTERIVPEKREKNFFASVKARRTAKIEGAAENVKIRKLYKKYMEEHTEEKQLTASVTPKELEQLTESGEVIRSLYEKARYSGVNCTKEETELLKQEMKRK